MALDLVSEALGVRLAEQTNLGAAGDAEGMVDAHQILDVIAATRAPLLFTIEIYVTHTVLLPMLV